MLELTVRGTPCERGRQIGATYADRIRADVRSGRFRSLGGWSVDGAEAAMGNILFAMLRHTPHYVEELRGLASGAGIDFRDAFLLNTAQAFTPLRAAFSPGDGKHLDPADDPFGGCSNIAVPQSALGPVLVKTVDGTQPVLEDQQRLNRHYVLLHFEPGPGDDWLPYAVVCHPGRLWPELGMNAAGLGGGQSSVPPVPGQRGHGVPVQWILRPALERARTVEQAVSLLAGIPMSGKGMNMGFVDAEGGAVGVEKSGDRQAALWPESPGGYAAVTNAYQSEVMADALPSLHPKNSAARLRAIRSLFAGPLRDPAARSQEAIEGLLRFHAQDPDQESICQHGGGHDDQMYTHHGFLLWAQRREIWAAAGYPCRATLQPFAVSAPASADHRSVASRS
jgi:hypothetical protein